MFFRSLFGGRKPPPREYVSYQVLPTRFDQKKKKWSKVGNKTSLKTSNLMQKKGSLRILGQAKPGERLLFTKSGAVYKRQERRWVPLAPAKGGLMGALFQFVFGPPKPKQHVDKEEGLVVEVHKQKIPPTKKLVKEVTKIDPELAGEIEKEQKKIALLQKEQAKLAAIPRTQNPRGRVQVNTALEKEVKELNLLVGTSKGLLAAHRAFEEASASSDSEPEFLAKGAIKHLYTRPRERRSLQPSVYMIAGSTLSENVAGAGTQEIKAEVTISQNIAKNLYKNHLANILQGVFREQDLEGVVERIQGRFATAEELVIACEIYDDHALGRELGIRDLKTIQAIRKAVKSDQEKLGKLGDNLAIKLEEVSPEERVKGKITVRAPKASRDLEKQIRKTDVPIESRIGYGSGILKGQAELHESGHVHGDCKPENILLYKESDPETGQSKEVVRISDFGKVQNLAPEETALYRGNPRYIAPERSLSREAESYSSAMMLIRVFEEPYLTDEQDVLVAPKELDTIGPKEGRRGIEKFAVVNKNMMQTESVLKGRVRVLTPSIAITQQDRAVAEKEMHAYIDELSRRQKDEAKISPHQRKELNKLLKEMTLSDPAKRPTLQEASDRYNTIFDISSEQ